MSSGTGYASVPGGQSDGNPAEKLKQRYINHAASVEPTSGAGEEALNTSAEHQAVIDRCNATRWDHSAGAELNGSAILSSAPALLVGYIVWELPTTAVVKIRNGTSAAGVDKGEIPLSGVAIGQFVPFKGAKFSSGIYIDLNGASTGNVTFLWWPQL